LDTGEANGRPLGNGLIELGGRTDEKARVIVRRIENLEGKPTYEVISVFKKTDQDEVFRYLKALKIMK
ncbi:MAG: hypothetical protein ABIQ44_00130, partial [Chloroflexia bacterium]